MCAARDTGLWRLCVKLCETLGLWLWSMGQQHPSQRQDLAARASIRQSLHLLRSPEGLVSWCFDEALAHGTGAIRSGRLQWLWGKLTPPGGEGTQAGLA